MTFRTPIALTSALVAFAALLLTAAPAFALQTHVFTGSFGAASSTPANPYPVTNPAAVAVDNSAGSSAGDVYVTDPANHRIEKFDSSGNFILMFGKGVNKTKVEEAGSTEAEQNICTAASGNECQAGVSISSPGAFETPTFVAVDGSSGLSAGDVYVGDTGDNLVSKFDSSGTLISSWGTSGQLNGFGPLAGIAVDTAGNLWVYDQNSIMDEFDQSGISITSWNSERGVIPIGIAVDSAGHLYVGVGARDVAMFTATGSEIGDISATSNSPTGLAVDPSNNDLYVDHSGGVIEHYALACLPGCSAPSYTFGTGHLSGAEGVAYDATSENVYVANAGTGNVAVFAPALIPNVIVTPVSNLTHTSVTLNAVVEPEGGEKVTACQFEYGISTAYSLGSVPCLNASNAEVGIPTNPITSRTEVHADLTGLQSETTYHYRLDATDAGGSNIGSDHTFMTSPAVTGISTESATDIKSTSAMLAGSYTGEGLDTHYYFEYGATTAYGEATVIKDNGEGTGPQAVPPVAISGLTPETTYHYRIVASNTFGSTPGPDATLTTAPAVAGLGTGPATSLAPASAMLAGSYTGEGLDTHYYFEWGTTTSYGTTTSVPPGEDAGEGTGPQAVPPVAISGLTPETTYHYRIVASNTFGTTVGQDETFRTTPPYLPVIESTAYSPGAAGTTAALEAQVNPGFGATVFRFQYGAGASYESSTPISESIGSDDSDHLASATISGLTPGTTYHYRAVAINFSGTSYSPDQNFTTPDLPVIASTSSSNPAQTTATLEAQINPEVAATTYHFEYGTGTAYGSRTPESASIGSDKVSHLASAAISGLSPGVTYHFRVVATNSVGTSLGPDHTFTNTPSGVAPVKPPPTKCKQGAVKKQGKCVKKKKLKHHKRRARHG